MGNDIVRNSFLDNSYSLTPLNQNTMEITVKQIQELQKSYGFDEMQKLIDNGMAWKLEGFTGRQAMSALESGACMLPEERHQDYYGNLVPSRNDLAGGKGSLNNSQEFWGKVMTGEIDLEEE